MYGDAGDTWISSSEFLGVKYVGEFTLAVAHPDRCGTEIVLSGVEILEYDAAGGGDSEAGGG